jgi:acyl-CoA reductase-like NAD-dependent aldehyde dehydrogenase
MTDPRHQLFVGGAFADAADGATMDAVSPRDGAVLAKVAAAGERDVDRAVAAARRAFGAGVWSGLAPRPRKRVLPRLAELIREHAGELATAGRDGLGQHVRRGRCDDAVRRVQGIRLRPGPVAARAGGLLGAEDDLDQPFMKLSSREP